MNTHNTFDAPDAVQPVSFDGARITGDGFAATLPAKSVVVLELK
jgi:alpha-N-arabinofuranosidase